MNYLAQCFAKRRMFDLATRTLQDALKEKLVFDDEKKELIYNLGCVLESMGKKDEAIKQFELIYEVDIGYRDVGAKSRCVLRRRANVGRRPVRQSEDRGPQQLHKQLTGLAAGGIRPGPPAPPLSP